MWLITHHVIDKVIAFISPLYAVLSVLQRWLGKMKRNEKEMQKHLFLDALASLDFNLSVSQSLSDSPFSCILQLAHLRVFQIISLAIDFYIDETDFTLGLSQKYHF